VDVEFVAGQTGETNPGPPTLAAQVSSPTGQLGAATAQVLRRKWKLLMS
jgi:hypothetical protein